MSSQTYRLWIATSLAIGSASLSPVARSQIVPDTTLPLDSISTFENNTWTIEGGTGAGGNLFHSFSDFSLPKDTTAYFNNALSIENIITRVTGGNISNIDGLLRANGAANLFLLNPNGIVFGPNARLDIGGSFVGSTADRIEFADGSSFSATNPATSPLLTVSVPIGLQMGANPGAIEVQGPGHGMQFVEGQFSINRSDRPLGLQVRPGRTLALLGGNIDLLGGNLTATGNGSTAGGRVELGSVAANSRVSLNPIAAGWQLGYEAVSAFQDIRLLNTASIDTSGAGAGAIHLQGRSILVRDGSGLVAFNLGAQPSDPITLRATDLIEFSGFDAADSYQSSILAKVNLGATGRGSDIDVQADRLQLLDGGIVSGTTLGAGDVGSLTVRASEVTIQGGRFRIETLPNGTKGRNDDPSDLGVQVTPSGTGRGGDVLVEADRLSVSDRAGIGSTTFGAGDAGNITIRARESVEVSNAASIQASVIRNDSATGNGGRLEIYTDRLLIASGANLRVATAAVGNAGSILVQARDIVVQGQFVFPADEIDRDPRSQLSKIESISTPSATGGAGNITIQTEQLRVENGALITASTNTRGNAGNLTIVATDVELSGRSIPANSKEDPEGSGLFSQVARAQATGDGGDLRVETDRLTMRDGATISTDTFGIGNAGSLTIVVRESLIAANDSGIGATTSLPTDKGNGGRGGDVTVSTDFLQLTDGSRISSTTRGRGRAGNIDIEAGEIQLSGETQSTPPFLSRIEANVNPGATGDGGTITIRADRLVASAGGRVTTKTQSSGNAGDIEIFADTIELSGTSSPRDPRPSGLFATAEVSRRNNTIVRPTGNGGSIILEVDRLDVRDRAQVSVSSGGTGSAGNLQIDAEQIRLDRGFLNADTTSGDDVEGNIILNVSDLRLRNGSSITTDSDSADGGNIAIDSDTIAALENSDISANAEAGNGGRVSITTQGLFGTAFRLQPTPASDITATSALGPEFNGVVIIQTPDVDPSSGLVKLPDTLLDVSQLIDDRLCRVGTRSSFSNVGRGGMPPSPEEELAAEIWDEPIVRQPSPPITPQTTSKISEPQSHEPLIEAQGWTIGERGEVILTTSPADRAELDPSSLGHVGFVPCQSE